MRRLGLILAAALVLAGCKPPPDGTWRRASAAEGRAYRGALAALAGGGGRLLLGEQVILADGQPLLVERWVQEAGKDGRVSETQALEPAPVNLWERVHAVQNAEMLESSETPLSRIWAGLLPSWPRPWTDGRLVFQEARSGRTPGRLGGEVRELWVRGLAEPGRGWTRRWGQDVIIINTDRIVEAAQAPRLGLGSHATLALPAMRAVLAERLAASPSLREALGGLQGGVSL